MPRLRCKRCGQRVLLTVCRTPPAGRRVGCWARQRVRCSSISRRQRCYCRSGCCCHCSTVYSAARSICSRNWSSNSSCTRSTQCVSQGSERPCTPSPYPHLHESTTTGRVQAFLVTRGMPRSRCCSYNTRESTDRNGCPRIKPRRRRSISRRTQLYSLHICRLFFLAPILGPLTATNVSAAADVFSSSLCHVLYSQTPTSARAAHVRRVRCACAARALRTTSALTSTPRAHPSRSPLCLCSKTTATLFTPGARTSLSIKTIAPRAQRGEREALGWPPQECLSARAQRGESVAGG